MENAEKTLTTGQVSGLLGIPVITLQRYVREYRVHFSTTASLKTRGRRFTSDDVSRVLIIRTMCSQRAKEAEIIQALQQPADGINMPDLFTILLTVNATIEYMEQKHAEIIKTIESFEYRRNDVSWIKQVLDLHKKAIDNLQTRIYRKGV